MVKYILEIIILFLVLRFLNSLFSGSSKPRNDTFEPPRQQPPPPQHEPRKQDRIKPDDDDYIDYEEVK